jgi:hypothetical protein
MGAVPVRQLIAEAPEERVRGQQLRRSPQQIGDAFRQETLSG